MTINIRETTFTFLRKILVILETERDASGTEYEYYKYFEIFCFKDTLFCCWQNQNKIKCTENNL